MAPGVLDTEDLSSIDVLQRKESTVPLLALLPHGLRGHHEDILEYLFGQVPVFRRRPTSDVCRCEQCRNEYPRIIKYAV